MGHPTPLLEQSWGPAQLMWKNWWVWHLDMDGHARYWLGDMCPYIPYLGTLCVHSAWTIFSCRIGFLGSTHAAKLHQPPWKAVDPMTFHTAHWKLIIPDPSLHHFLQSLRSFCFYHLQKRLHFCVGSGLWIGGHRDFLLHLLSKELFINWAKLE